MKTVSYEDGKAAFEEFVTDNPQFFPEFCKIAIDLRRQGYHHIHARTILGLCRGSPRITLDGKGGFSVKNDFSSYVARMFKRATKKEPVWDSWMKINRMEGEPEGDYLSCFRTVI